MLWTTLLTVQPPLALALVLANIGWLAISVIWTAVLTPILVVTCPYWLWLLHRNQIQPGDICTLWLFMGHFGLGQLPLVLLALMATPRA